MFVEHPPLANDAKRWDITGHALLPDDPLANCLVLLTRLFNCPQSAQTLTAGLPLVESKLTPDLFVRAAERAGLSARVVRRPLKKIIGLSLPAVLLLKNGQSCVVTKKSDTNVFTVLQPDAGAGETFIGAEVLEQHYEDYVIFVQPKIRFDARSDSIARPAQEHWFWDTLKQFGGMYKEVILITFLVNIFGFVVPLFTMNVYDRVVPNHTFETLWVLAAGISIIFTLDFLMRGMRAYLVDVAGKKIDLALSSKIFQNILGVHMTAKPTSVGGFASALSEFESFREFLTSATIIAVIDIPFVTLYLLLIWWIGGPMIFVPLAAIPLVVLPSLALRGTLSRLTNETMRVSTLRQSTLFESLSALETLKASTAESAYQYKWEQLIAYMGKLTLKSRLLSALSANAATLVQQVAGVGAVILGVYLIADNMMTMGALIACTMLTSRTLAPLAQIASLATRFHHAQSSLSSLDATMKLPVERPPGKSYTMREKFHGEIEFRNVTFAYPNQPVDALHDVSFVIRPGEKVAIVGRIGSGKSTIQRLILGFYQPISGSVCLDGIDLQQLDPAVVRQRIGYVEQDPVLFFGSVKDNIVLGSPYVDEQAMLKAADSAGVSDFVNRHPQGFDMAVGERGLNISGGQRQSIAIARALLHAPPLLLLDEPTSSLDNRSEELFKKRLSAESGNQTVVLVTHRVSMLSIVDRIIIVEGGRIVADGPKGVVMDLLREGKLNVAPT
jgi:ATP-binding cassette, subfamily C, bacterial LapB